MIHFKDVFVKFYFTIIEFERREVTNFIYFTLVTNNRKVSFFGFAPSLYTLNQSLMFNSSFFVMRTSFLCHSMRLLCVSSAYVFALVHKVFEVHNEKEGM